MKYIVAINGKNYEVEVEKGQASIVRTTAAAPVAATATTAATPVTAAPTAESVQGAVKAPMPGTILAVNVSQGTAVKKGDTLLILEAMKMENEIAAPKDGVIAQITAVKGASVATGDVLVVLQ
ncbi:MAG: acetyl-CoA carboxylase biotin carboxyl carrier protein subunit [Clostridiales bacterium GWB2_37_7]|nr:MAG: acetyl-CoA carboxylase biotin carboxyl carrier protein subunit [Clostridiales bacterium GWB2_37_7]